MSEPTPPSLETIWAQFRDAMFITPEEWERITGVVTLHLTLDAYLSTILSLRLSAPMKEFPELERLTKYLSGLSFGARLEFVKALGYVGAEARGGPLTHFKHAYFRAVRAPGLAGNGVGVHGLRHTWASRFAEATGDLVLLQALGGWSSLTLVQRYAHARQERGAEAIRRMLEARERATRPAVQLEVIGRASGRV